METHEADNNFILKNGTPGTEKVGEFESKHQNGGVRSREPRKPIDGGCGGRLLQQREKARRWRKARIQKPPCGKGKGNDLPNPRNVPRARKEPRPMCERALPESFWKEPMSLQTSSLSGNVYSKLPPLFSSDNNNTEMDITEIRPLTPPGEKNQRSLGKPKRYMTSPPDTELLFSLFDEFENKIDKRLIVKRGRPKKLPTDNLAILQPPKKEDDPCMVDDLAEKIFPQLSLNGSSRTAIQKHAVIKLPNGEKTVELPAIQLEKHYPAMLNQLAMHL